MTAKLPDALRFQAFLTDGQAIESVAEAARMAGLGDDGIHPGGLPAALQALSLGRAPEILLVDLSEADDLIAAVDQLADECEQHTRVIALGSVNDIHLYRKLIEMGVSDYLIKPLDPQQVASALQRVRTSLTPALPEKTTSTQVVAVIGSRGGAGSSSIATSLAWALAHRHQQRTVLVDLDLQFGSVAMTLDLEPSRGLREILGTPDRIDTLLIASAMSQESERLRILSAEESLEADIQVGEQGLKALLEALQPDSDQVVLDVPRRLDSLGRGALAQAEVICIAADLSLVSMRDTKRLLKLCQDINPAARRLLVGNRVGGIVGEVPQPEFERGIGAKFDFRLPDDPKAAAAAADQGKSLIETAAENPFAAEFGRLLGQIQPSTEDKPDKAPEKSLLKRLFGS
ncbi:AAA family ATPase [Altericroceibacterium xinjiangense]|uniref:AAA family ATPase n=1 Tax=Altericroceibacterium xinjiangense TaxID=762261 RepID=UPI000F7D953B|nr:AAA family ATPase [Altericroceibacterium xinjiangense]